MENSISPKLNRFLKLEYSNKKDIWLSSQDSLRKLVGILGMLLPVLLFTFLFVDSGVATPLPSISHYYYTRVGSIFIIVVSLLAIFLLVYKGEAPVDFYISSLAGIFALVLILFPTSNISDICCDTAKKYSVTVLKKSDFRVNLHYISAAIFLLSLAYMSLFLFTKSDKIPSQRPRDKKIRNRIFRTCGVIMALAVLVIFLRLIKIINADQYDNHHLTFWMESIAVESFGVSWLIKGKLFFIGP